MTSQGLGYKINPQNLGKIFFRLPLISFYLNESSKDKMENKSFMKYCDSLINRTTEISQNQKVDNYTRAKDEKAITCARNACDKNGTKTCTACKLVKYCSSECQRAHWATHRESCLKNRSSK